MRKKLYAGISLCLVCLLSGCSRSTNRVLASVRDPAAGGVPWIEYGEKGAADETFTGLKKLPEKIFVTPDADNAAGYDTTPVEHYFGVAENGEVHRFSAEFQQEFNEKQYNAFVYDDKTDEKRIYLTFDCGYENGNTGRILDVLKEKSVPAAFFCTKHELESSPEIAARIINEGHILGNHSDTHPDFSAISRTKMTEEIAAFDAYLRENFGYSSGYFRFPAGKYNESAIRLLNELGYACIFWSAAYDDWHEDRQKGAEYALQKVTDMLHPGEILLLHAVSSDNADAMGDIIDEARRQGYVFCSLPQLYG